MPAKDGAPTVQELIVSGMIDEAGKSEELKAVQVLDTLRTRFGREPEWDEVETEIGLDPRREKPCPLTEDCSGCNGRNGGPHKCGCAQSLMEKP